MTIRCWKCGTDFEPGILRGRGRTKCPKCGNTILFTEIRLIRNCYLVIVFLVAALMLCGNYLTEKVLHWPTASGVFLVIALAVAAFYGLYLNLTCLLYNRYALPKLKSGAPAPGRGLFALDMLVILVLGCAALWGLARLLGTA